MTRLRRAAHLLRQRTGRRAVVEPGSGEELMDRYQMHKYRHGKRGRYSVCMRCCAKRRNRGRVVNGRVTPKWQYMAPGFAQWMTTNPPCAEKERVMRKCSHIVSRFTFVDGVPMLLRCTGCRALLSMGPSDDKPAAVRVEMRAAELIQHRVMRTKRKFMTRLEYLGMVNVEHDEMESLQWRAGETLMGWLACDDPSLKTFDAWPWDISRPIAEQWPNVPASDDTQPGGKLPDAALTVAAANDVDTAAELYASSQDRPADDKFTLAALYADMQRTWNSNLDAARTEPAAAAIRDPNESAPGWQDRVLAAIEADNPVLEPINWPGFIGVEKPTGDPLDGEARAKWNAGLDAVESVCAEPVRKEPHDKYAGKREHEVRGWEPK